MAQLCYEEKNFEEGSRLKRESLFHLASGALGIRGCFEEGAPDGAPSIRGAYLNGFCETEPIHYNERLHGFPEEKQLLVNLPDAQTIRLTAGGQRLACFTGRDLVQTLDMENGVSVRSFVCDTPSGSIALTFTRLVSFVRPNLFAIECCAESLGFEGEIRVESTLNPDVCNFTDKNDPRVASGNGRLLRTVGSEFIGGTMAAVVETQNSRRMAVCVSAHNIPCTDKRCNGTTGELTFCTKLFLKKGGSVKFCKFSVYREIPDEFRTGEAIAELGRAAEAGFETLKKEQREYLDEFWKNARVTVEGDEELQSQLDFCLWGMLSSAGKDGRTSVAAKGLSGEGYEGHYFWDSEIYIFPFFLATEPKIARSLLEYRYLHLDGARRHAAFLGHTRGALYPWRTITGGECSSYYPSGSAQYHINGDIAHAFSSYRLATGDDSFLPETCEVLVETARLWLETGHFSDGTFRIDCVTGPDEYTCVVNNNYYTNACAAENLINAEKFCRELDALGGLDALKEKLSLTEEELSAFREAGEKMFYPHDEKLGIIAQDDSFLSKKRCVLSDIPKENFPLLMHYHPLIINRYQVLKQADSVLANHIYREEDTLTMRRSFAYYEEITTHDSSLSNCIYSIMAARLGDLERADRYFRRCVGTDTGDHNGNTKDGLHIANMGGVYRVMTVGFGGVKISEDGLSVFPLLPKSMEKITFPVYYRGRRIRVTVADDASTVCLETGEPMEIEIYGRKVFLDENKITVSRRVRGVLFDLDGVITDTASFHYLAWKKMADAMGIPFDEERNECFKGVSRAKCLELLLGWGGRDVSEDEFASLLKEKNDLYCEYLDDLTPDSVLPGIRESLAMLKKRGIPAALFSVSKNTDRILAGLGMTDAFDAVVTGNDITFSKPHFEGYLLAAQRIGTDPRLCVMVEDSAAGITGAKEVSMKTLAIMRENVAGADLCVRSTSEVPAALETLL